jgi:hypothetical protein
LLLVGSHAHDVGARRHRDARRHGSGLQVRGSGERRGEHGDYRAKKGICVCELVTTTSQFEE